MILPKTIKDGDAVIAWKPDGTREIITGPKTIFAPLNKIHPLNRISAREEEYLIIEYKDGRTEHRCGPNEMWIDPLIHAHVRIAKAVNLDAHQAI